MRPLAFAAALLAVPATAQAPTAQPAPAFLPGTPNTQGIAAGAYKVEPKHTQITFAIDHMGFSIFRGTFSQASGSLTLDPAQPTKTVLSVTVPIASLHTSNDDLNRELLGADWFGADQFGQASFVSTKVTLGPNNLARVDGTLTLHGVSKPAVLMARFHGAGTNPLDKVSTIGFDGQMIINRSDFGITKYPNLLSDRVQLTIGAAFEKVG